MKRLILLTFALLPFLAACDSTFIDDIFTFNIEKSFEVTIPAGAPAGYTIEPTIPIPINDSILDDYNTSLSLLKSAKLTKLQLVFSEPSFRLSDIDTLEMRMKSASHASTSLANYYSGMDSIQLTNVDFAPIVKDTDPAATMKVRLKNSTTQEVKTTVKYTLTITAHPF